MAAASGSRRMGRTPHPPSGVAEAGGRHALHSTCAGHQRCATAREACGGTDGCADGTGFDGTVGCADADGVRQRGRCALSRPGTDPYVQLDVVDDGSMHLQLGGARLVVPAHPVQHVRPPVRVVRERGAGVLA